MEMVAADWRLSAHFKNDSYPSLLAPTYIPKEHLDAHEHHAQANNEVYSNFQRQQEQLRNYFYDSKHSDGDSEEQLTRHC